MTITPDVDWQSSANRVDTFEAPVRTLGKLKGLNVRIGGITILDIKRGFLSLRSDADIYPLFLVAAPGVELPLTVLPVRVFNDIEAGQKLPLPEVAAPTIFRAGTDLPGWIDVHVVVMKSRQRARDLAKGIQEAMASDEGKAIQTAILTAITAANPTAGVVAPLAVGLLNLVCRFISNGQDTQLFYSHASIEQADDWCVGTPIELTDGKHASVVLNVQAVK